MATPSDDETAEESVVSVEEALASTKSHPLDGDHGLAEVSLFWKDVKRGSPIASTGKLTATIVNNAPHAVSVRLSVVSSGLDGQLVEAAFDSLKLDGKASHDVHLDIGALPIQSEVASSFAVVQAQLDRDDGTIVRVPTTPLYYHFDKNYAQAVFQSPEDVATSAGGGVFTDDPLEVKGRIRTIDGTLRDLTPPSGKALTAPRQGLSGARAFPANAANDGDLAQRDNGVGSMMQPMGATSTVKLCTRWLVQYIDSGFGEDVWPTSSWQHVPAKFVRVKILTPSNVVYWQGQADVNGCFTAPLEAGSYKLVQYTDDVSDGTVTLSSYYVQDGVPYWYGIFTNFSVSGATTLYLSPTFNNDAVQAAAVAGQALAAHQFNGGMAFTPGTYRIHTNEGCGPNIDPPTDSCYSNGIVHIGTTSVNGYIDSHWKFVIGHELGHMVQDRGMGKPYFNYSDTATEGACKCDHYSSEWGNSSHCIQSREISGGAQNEGFGHAFATRTFNYTQYGEARFVYYKPVFLLFGVAYPPVAAKGFEPANWMKDHCPLAERGVEYDWLTFYTNLAGSYLPNNTPFSALFNIYKRACVGTGSGKCIYDLRTVGWSKLRLAASAHYGSELDARYMRFVTTGAAHGVNY